MVVAPENQPTPSQVPRLQLFIVVEVLNMAS